MKKTLSLLLLLHSIRAVVFSQSPPVTISASALTGCAPLEVTFTGNAPSSAANFYWGVSHQGTVENYLTSGNQLSYTFQGSGKHFYVYLDVYDANWNYLGSSSVGVKTHGVEPFIVASPATVCPNTDVLFFTNYGFSSYSWSFGDGNSQIGNSSNNTKQFSQVGDYEVKVKFQNVCGDYDSASTTVMVRDNLNSPVQINASSTNICPGSVVDFNSGFRAVAYSWDFGDGNTQNGFHANHTFSVPGDYEVKLYTLNGCGIWDSATQVISVNSGAGFPSYISLYGPSDACPGEKVKFFTFGSYKSFEFNFGDGTVLTSNNSFSPFHAYQNTGQYIASVKITNFCGNDTTVSTTIDIRGDVRPSEQNIDLGGDLIVCPNSTARYWIYGPSLQLKSYFWQTSEGNSDSTLVGNFSQVYSTLGTKTVTVTATNYCNLDTTMSFETNVLNNLPVTIDHFSVFPQVACPGEPVNIEIGTEKEAYFSMVFSDNPSDTIAENRYTKSFNQVGNYSVFMSVQNTCGNDTVIQRPITVVNDKGFPPSLQINCPEKICLGSKISIFAPNGYKSYSWYVNNQFIANYETANGLFGYTFNSPGNVEVSVNFKNYCGRDTSISKTVLVVTQKDFDNIIVSAPPTVCPGDEWSPYIGLDFADQSLATYTWNFMDGDTLVSLNGDVRHAFQDTGTYNTTVNISNGCGADTTLVVPVVVATNSPISEEVYVVAEVNTRSICPGSLIKFRASKGYKKYFWDFGNNDTLSTKTPEVFKAFNTLGNQKARVTVFNECGKSKKAEYSFKISNDAKVAPFFVKSSQQEACAGDLVTFALQLTNYGGNYISYGMNFEWNFGDGSFANTANPNATHFYTQPGNYTVTVKGYNTCGDTSISSTSVSVSDGVPPSLVYTQDGNAILVPNSSSNANACPGDVVSFYYIGDFASDNFVFGDGTSSSSTGSLIYGGVKYKTVSHVYDAPGSYWVKLTVTNSCGLSVSDSILVKIASSSFDPNIEILVMPSKNVGGHKTCIPVEFILSGAKTYTINFGDGNVTTTSSSYVKHTYENVGYYIISVDGTNGCGKTSNVKSQVTIMPGGSLSTLVNINSPSCFNGNDASVSISVSNGVPPYSFDWRNFNTTGNSLNGVSAGVYYVTITDSVGCTKEMNIEINDAPEITAEIVSQTNPNCTQSNGSLTLAAQNGNAPYTYTWYNGTIGETINNIPSGLHAVEIKDATGCVKTISVPLLDVNGPVIMVDSGFSVLKVCKGSNDANVEVSVTSGTAPFTYTWSNGAFSPNQSNLAEGTYTLTVSDAAGCKATQQVIIDAYPALIADINVTKYPDCKQSNGEVSFVVRGGSGSYELSVDGNPISSFEVAGLAAGKHTLSITDLTSFCVQDTVFYLDNSGNLSANVISKNPKCYGSSDGIISVSATGGTPSYFTIVTSDVGYTSPKSNKVLFNNLAQGSYYIKIEDKVGCLINKVINLKMPDSISVQYDVLSAYCGANNGQVSGLISGGTQPYTINFNSNNQVSTDSFAFSNLAGSSYTLTITDSNFCQKSKTVVVATEANNISIELTPTASMCGRLQGSVSSQIGGGYPPYSYSWSNGSTSSSGLQQLNPGVYQLFLTDSRGCSSSAIAYVDTIIDNPGICLVTVDSLTEKNLVVWEKPLLSNIQSFKIYKEANVQNEFIEIGTVPINQLSEFLDVTSETRVSKDRYRISAVDSCGNESELSGIHETIHLTINQGVGNNWNLIWNNYQGLPIVNYSIWRSTDSINYTFIASRPAAIDPQLNTYTDMGAPAGDIYYQVSFEAPNECNSNLFKNNPNHLVMGTYRKVKSNVSSNRTGGPTRYIDLFNNRLEVYPNPTNNRITVEFGYFDNPKSIEIVNQLGQVVYVADLKQIQGNQINLNLTNFDSGVYTVRFVSDKSNLTKRIVKY